MANFKNLFYLIITLWPLAGRAGILDSLETAAGGTGLEGRDLTNMIALIINALLGLLGTAFVVLILIGGFKWMTSRGNAQQIEDAKKTITSAAIGLAIVLASYALARFIIMALRGIDEGGGSTMGS